MPFARLSIFVVFFSLILALFKLIPGMFAAYRNRYQDSSRRTARELRKFFFDVKPAYIIIAVAGLAILVGLFTSSWVLGVAIGAVGLFAPKMVLSIWKEIRSTQFDAQLLDGMLIIGNSLRSGLDIVAGIERVATSLKPPISEEFGLVINAYRLGAPLERALLDLTERINSRNLETVVYAINIQRETGGNIIKTFDQMITTIRDEGKLQKKVRALTSQGRTQIIFLAVFPWVLGGLFFVIAPDFLKPVFDNTWGQVAMVFLVVWEAVGLVVTKRIVTVDV